MKKLLLLGFLSFSFGLTLKAQIHGSIEGNSDGTNVGIGTSTPAQKLTVDTRQTSPNAGVPATSGQTQNGIMRLQVDGNSWGEVLDFGMNVLPTYAWLQATNRGNLAIAYNLALNPNGGNVGIGVSRPEARLHIASGNDDGLLIGNYNDRLGWSGTGTQPGYHIRFAGYRDVTPNFTGAKISALRTDYCCSALAQGMELAFSVSQLATASGDANLSEAMRIKSNGSVGIGTAQPQYKLHVNGSTDEVLGVISGGMQNRSTLAFYTTEPNIWHTRIGSDNRSFVAYTNNLQRLRITEDGNVGIGTSTPDSKLTVAGKIHSQEVKVTIDAGADYVFEKKYELKPLSEVEAFVKENKHLPEIAAARIMEKEGVDLGAMNIQLLKKIEELTLYMIEQGKAIKTIQAENEKLQSEMNTIKSNLKK